MPLTIERIQNMKTKNYYAYPAHKTGYTREQHALLRRGEVLVIDHDGLVGRGYLSERIYRAWGRPDSAAMTVSTVGVKSMRGKLV